jgi:predicted RNA binding protein YcfA (HicA-like mRNA interferase family)
VGKREKLIERICTRQPSEARFSDVRQLLEFEGYVLRRQKGSHVTFVKEGAWPFVVPKSGERVKRAYLDEICSDSDLDLY